MAYAETRQCEWCGTVFHPTRRWQTFCATKCRGLNANERRRQGTALLAGVGAAVGMVSTATAGLGIVGLTTAST